MFFNQAQWNDPDGVRWNSSTARDKYSQSRTGATAVEAQSHTHWGKLDKGHDNRKGRHRVPGIEAQKAKEPFRFLTGSKIYGEKKIPGAQENAKALRQLWRHLVDG